MKKPGHVPAESSGTIPMLVCRNVADEVEFCKNVFGALELGNRSDEGGKKVHALMTINDEMIIIESEWPTLASRSPARDGSSPVVIFVYVEDVDSVTEKAEAGGAQILVPVKDQFWGDRTARIMDREGHVWLVATRIEKTSSEERAERWSKIIGKSTE